MIAQRALLKTQHFLLAERAPFAFGRNKAILNCDSG